MDGPELGAGLFLVAALLFLGAVLVCLGVLALDAQVLIELGRLFS
jgi:hypothetical protein